MTVFPAGMTSAAGTDHSGVEGLAGPVFPLAKRDYDCFNKDQRAPV